MAPAMLGIRCRGFKGWSLSGWSSLHLYQVGRRPSHMNDNPTWDKDAHLTKPSVFNYKACFDDDDDDDDDSSSEEDEAEGSPVRKYLNPYYGDLGEEAIKEIEKYIFSVYKRLNSFPYEIKLGVPQPVRERFHKNYACVVGCPLPFHQDLILHDSWKGNLEERDKLSASWAIDDYNKRMDQDMSYLFGIWAYIDTVAHAFFISFMALNNRTVPFRHLPACLLKIIKGIPLNFQRCHSVKIRKKDWPTHFDLYITFVATAIDGTFYCDTKVGRRNQRFEVLFFTKIRGWCCYGLLTWPLFFIADKPYVDLNNQKSLSLITKCAIAAVELYKKKMGVYMGPPKVMMAYHSLSLGPNAYHIRFKSLNSSGHVSICSTTVIYDVDDVGAEEDKRFVLCKKPKEKRHNYMVESFIICPGAWQDSDLQTKQTGDAEFQDKTAETVKEISLEFPKPAAMDVEDESPADSS
ncbi:hypothetical protein Tsubulata_018737 [Turnera subulata]|uniref:Uncharacterized protein n=1 Tax=Turnera subulata TaxID=218843 RepID=A0A9Q0G222_9ROSI|nr:hypothetical protein Tsubulata_018737 [Turnera subulata]